jgi:Asp-tRNA(Asn)/Glu-tRNA(Gln) amidotransferase A subunit family amidase
MQEKRLCMTLEELSRAIAEGTYSCSELTMEALQRIAANDQEANVLTQSQP